MAVPILLSGLSLKLDDPSQDRSEVLSLPICPEKIRWVFAVVD